MIRHYDTRHHGASAPRRILFFLIVTLLAAGLACIGPAARADAFNWTAVPVGQQVPIVQATFDQGGYQLTDGDGEVITVPFINGNLYSMQFCISPTGEMYFVNTGSVPILYAPYGAYIENATVPGAHWFPFSPTFQPATPVYVGLAPSWDAYVAMGWYSGMHYYGGYWSADAYYDGVVYAPAPGLYFEVDGRRYDDWGDYHTYYVNRGGYYHEGYHQYGIYDHASRQIGPGGHAFDGPHSRAGGFGGPGRAGGPGGFGRAASPGGARPGSPGAAGERKFGGAAGNPGAGEHKFGGGETGRSDHTSEHTFGSGSKTGLGGSSPGIGHSGGLGSSGHTFGSGSKTGIGGGSSTGIGHSGTFGGGSASHSGTFGGGGSSTGIGHSGRFGSSSSHGGTGFGGSSSGHSGTGFGGGGSSSHGGTGFGGGGSSSHSGGGFSRGSMGGSHGSSSSSGGSRAPAARPSAPSKPKH